MERYEFTIPLNPVTKKNSSVIARVGGRLRIIPSKKYRDYEAQARQYIPALHIDYPVNVQATYYRAARYRVDLCNLHEALCDVLTKWECVEDDNINIIHSMDGSRCYYDHDNPRTEIIIERRELNGEEERPFDTGAESEAHS